MESQRHALKLFVREPCAVPEHDFVLFFHRVIQDGLFRETFVDVTDYSHVPNGPGVMLICHEAHYSMDRAEGRLGLKCAVKRGATGDSAARIERVIGKALRAAAAMESHEILGGRLRFDTAAALFSVEDRLLYPNKDETFDAVAPVLSGIVARTWESAPTLVRKGSPKECFQVSIAVPGERPLPDLVARLGA